jgi:hypothetical protein
MTLNVDVDAPVVSARATRRFQRWLALLVGLTAIAAATLAFIESDSGRQEERAFVESARLAVDIFAEIAASNPRVQFEANATRNALEIGSDGDSRVLGARGDLAIDWAVAQQPVQERASKRLLGIAGEMSELPDDDPRLDPYTKQAINSDREDWNALLKQQHAAVDRADEAGTRQNRAFASLGLTATAAALLGLAALMGAGRAGRIALVTAAVALVAAAVYGSSGYIA